MRLCRRYWAFKPISHKVVEWGRGLIVPIGVGTLNRNRNLGLDLQVGWVGQVVKVLDYCNAGIFFRASSYEHSQTGWLGFWDLVSPLFFCKNIDVFIWEAWLVSVFATEISVTGWKFSHMNTPARWPGPNIFNKIASLSPDSSQNGIILVLYVFSLQEYAK